MSQPTQFNDFEHWWTYILSKQPTQEILSVLLRPQVKAEFVDAWNKMVKEESGAE